MSLTAHIHNHSTLTIVGEKGRTFKIDLKNPLQRRYGMVRELSLSSEQRALICAKFSYTRKTGNEYLRAWNELGGEGLMDKPGVRKPKANPGNK